ncbi:translation protein, partial [Baffinella frigidus]
MSNWLPIHKALLDIVCLNLPSPACAQMYRSELLYTGPADDACSQGMRMCDPQSPLILYISRMVPSADKGRFIAWGRVFSGSMKARARARIMGPNYRHGGSEDLQLKIVPRVVLLVGRRQESVESVPAGNVCGLTGIDQ